MRKYQKSIFPPIVIARVKGCGTISSPEKKRDAVGLYAIWDICQRDTHHHAYLQRAISHAASIPCSSRAPLAEATAARLAMLYLS